MTPKKSDTKDTEVPPVNDTRQILENDVELLHQVADDLASVIKNIGEADSQANDLDRRAEIDTVFSDLDIGEILAESGFTKAVISDFKTIIDLLEQDQYGGERELRLLLSSPIAEQLSEKFPINSYFQKLDEETEIQIRQQTGNNRDLPGIVIKEETIYFPLSFGTVDTYFEIPNERVFEVLDDEFVSLFEEAGEMDLDVPPWRELLEELAATTSAETAEEFESLVEAATPDDLDSLDEVSLALIAGARTGALQYNISKWGEEMNIGSKATFSRRKSSLVDDGIITTEPVQVEIGRPRERLLINEGLGSSNHESFPENMDSETEAAGSQDSGQTSSDQEEDSKSESLDDKLDEVLRDVLLSE